MAAKLLPINAVVSDKALHKFHAESNFACYVEWHTGQSAVELEGRNPRFLDFELNNEKVKSYGGGVYGLVNCSRNLEAVLVQVDDPTKVLPNFPTSCGGWVLFKPMGKDKWHAAHILPEPAASFERSHNWAFLAQTALTLENALR